MIEIESKQQLDNMLFKNEKLLVLFYASWCSFCSRFVPVFDEKIEYFKKALTIRVLLDDFDNQLWDDYEIESVPTIIYFEKGKVSKRLDAKLGRGLNEEKFKVWIKEFDSNR
jgi:thioredoxin 1